jgi:hypothetical protein
MVVRDRCGSLFDHKIKVNLYRDRMKNNQLGAIALCMCSTLSVVMAGQLQECKFDSSVFGMVFNGQGRSSADAATVIDVRGDLKNGEVIAYSKNDPILVVDLNVTDVIPTMVPAADFAIKSSWMLSPNYRFQANRAIPVPVEVKSADDKLYYSINQGSTTVFVDRQGQFCNKALVNDPQTRVWAAGTLSQEPEQVAIDFKLVERPSKPRSMRVIFNGVSAGQLSFQEVWVSGSTILNSHARIFDQFAKQVDIGPFTFEVMGTEGEKVKLKYDIASRFQPDNAQMSRLRMAQGVR